MSNTVSSADAANLASACMAEAKRRLGPDAPLSNVVQLATRIETAVGRVRVTKQEVDERVAKLMDSIEQAIEERIVGKVHTPEDERGSP